MRDEHFEWDDEKARLNAANHDVTFEEATEVFGPGEAFVRYDREHSLVEDRFMIIGHSARGRILAVWHTHRDGRVRIIGARLATPAERRAMKKTIIRDRDEMPAEFDFTNAVPNPYFVAMHGADYVRVIDKDLAKVFPDNAAMNAALRTIAEAGKRAVPKKRSAKTATAPKTPAKKKAHS